MASNQPSMDGYYAAMGWLSDNRPHMVDYIAALGAPRNDLKCDRAMVVMGLSGKPQLYANDEFLQSLTPAEAAGVLVHEWRHVLLNHLGEAAHPKPEWRIPYVLEQAHEALINDSLELTGYSLPDDVVTGARRGGNFYGYWDTDESYGPMEEWFLSQLNQPQPPPAPEEQDEDKDEQSDSSNPGQNDSDKNRDDQEAADSPQQDGGQGKPTQDDSSEDSSEGSQSDDPSKGDGSPEDSDGAGSEPSNAGPQGEPSQDGQSDSGSAQDSAASEGASEGPSDGAKDGQPAGDGSAQASDGEQSADSSSNADDSTSGEPQDGQGESCGKRPYREDENGNLQEMTAQEVDDYLDSLKDFLVEVLKGNPMPEDERPSEHELDEMDPDVAEAIDPSRGGDYSKAGVGQSEAEKIVSNGRLNLGWVKLLQKINPAVGKDNGGMNAKSSYNWARTRRSTSLVRGANLPTAGAPRGAGAAGKLRPTALIALDFSQSIDRRLARALSEMAQSIPPEHIDARCITFSTYAVHYDFKSDRNAVASGGTDFSCIELEARKIQKETGNYPYVICLTDGQAWFSSPTYDRATGRSEMAEPTDFQLKNNWLWVDVLTEDDERAFKNSTAYEIVRSQPNISALPYDRSKL